MFQGEGTAALPIRMITYCPGNTPSKERAELQKSDFKEYLITHSPHVSVSGYSAVSTRDVGRLPYSVLTLPLPKPRCCEAKPSSLEKVHSYFQTK